MVNMYLGFSMKRRMMMGEKKRIPNGVYLATYDGTYYPVNSYPTDLLYKVEGIAVVHNNHKIIFIADFQYSVTDVPWYISDDLVPNVCTTVDKSIALNDFAGLANTEAVYDFYGEDIHQYENAFKLVLDPFVFEFGDNAHLPSLGELSILFKYKTEIDECIEFLNQHIGNTPFSWLYSLNDFDLWSSTQRDHETAWRLRWETGEYLDDWKSTNYTNLAFLCAEWHPDLAWEPEW